MPAAGGKKRRTLAFDYVVVVRLGNIDIEASFELKKLALREQADRPRVALDDLKIAVRDQHRRSAGVEKIACQDSTAIAPDRIRRGPAAAMSSKVDHVIVHEIADDPTRPRAMPADADDYPTPTAMRVPRVQDPGTNLHEVNQEHKRAIKIVGRAITKEGANKKRSKELIIEMK